MRALPVESGNTCRYAASIYAGWIASGTCEVGWGRGIGNILKCDRAASRTGTDRGSQRYVAGSGGRWCDGLALSNQARRAGSAARGEACGCGGSSACCNRDRDCWIGSIANDAIRRSGSKNKKYGVQIPGSVDLAWAHSLKYRSERVDADGSQACGHLVTRQRGRGPGGSRWNSEMAFKTEILAVIVVGGRVRRTINQFAIVGKLRWHKLHFVAATVGKSDIRSSGNGRVAGGGEGSTSFCQKRKCPSVRRHQKIFRQ